MIYTSPEYDVAAASGATALVVMILRTAYGEYALSDKPLTPEMLGLAGLKLADGSWLADGSIVAGGNYRALLASGDLVSKFGRIRETLSPIRDDIAAGLRSGQASTMSVVLEDQDGLLAGLDGTGELAGAEAEILFGYAGLEARHWIKRYSGQISKYTFDGLKMTLNLADTAAGLTSTVSLATAGGYSAPRNAADRLPWVFGDMTAGGSGGQWTAVCIDTASYKYCVAGHPVLSVADGNAVSVFDKDGTEISSGWTFNHDDGGVATITLTSNQQSAEPITVSCKGWVDDAGDLATNPVDIALAIAGLAGWPDDDIDQASAAQARHACTRMGYQAAGVVNGDSKLGDILAGLMGCFAGSAWRDAAGKVRLTIDLGTGIVNEAAGVATIDIGPAEISATSSIDDVCNRVAVDYCFNWATNTYAANNDGSEETGRRSVALYGTRNRQIELPWVRHASVATALQQAIVARYSMPRRRLTFSPIDGFVQVGLEGGDNADITTPRLTDGQGRKLTNQLVRVVSVDIDPDKRSITIEAVDTGLFKTTASLADGSVMADGSDLAGGRRYVEAS